MKRKKSELRKILLISTIFLAILIVLIILVNPYLIGLNNNFNNQNIYNFKNLQLSLIRPVNWEISENRSYADLIDGDDKINVSRNGTNFSNINDYLNDFDSKRTIEVELEQELTNNGYAMVKRVEKFNGGPVNEQKVYYIYVSNWVYALSTSSESLYDELDQITRSFKYTGD